MSKSPERRRARAALARATQQFGAGDPRTLEARRRFDETAVEEVVASLPPLTDAQRRRLSRLIASGSRQAGQ